LSGINSSYQRRLTILSSSSWTAATICPMALTRRPGLRLLRPRKRKGNRRSLTENSPLLMLRRIPLALEVMQSNRANIGMRTRIRYTTKAKRSPSPVQQRMGVGKMTDHRNPLTTTTQQVNEAGHGENKRTSKITPVLPLSTRATLPMMPP